MEATLLLLLLLRGCQTWEHSGASVVVSPRGLQYFEYEDVTVSCKHHDQDEWTVWSNTVSGSKPEPCWVSRGSGTRWSCTVSTAKEGDSGLYWCESKHRDSSHAVNITITTNGSAVVLQSPVPPVTEGQDVRLSCHEKNKPPNLPAAFYKDDLLITAASAGHMTIRNFTQSNEGRYSCAIGRGTSPPSWLLMKGDSGPAVLTVSPDSWQLFEYEDLRLSCGVNSSRRGWRVIRHVTSADRKSWESCAAWGDVTADGCILNLSKTGDSGVYWCQSETRQLSNSAAITVFSTSNKGADRVIVMTPLRPVMEGHAVTLQCKTKSAGATKPAAFYKDGVHLRNESTGHMTLYNVTKDDEGLYHCTIRGHEASNSSWLFIRVPAVPSAEETHSDPLILVVSRHLVVASPYCIVTVLMVSVYRHSHTGRKLRVAMTTSADSSDDDTLDQPYDDVIADVTTEHQF